MNKIILPTYIHFDVTLNLHHIARNKCTINFTKQENSMLHKELQGKFTPETCEYDTVYRCPEYLEDLKGHDARRFALALNELIISEVKALTQGQVDVTQETRHSVMMAAEMINWALNDHEIPVGVKRKVLIHVETELQGKEYIVHPFATSPGYTRKDKKSA